MARVVATEVGGYELASGCLNGPAERFELTSLTIMSVTSRAIHRKHAHSRKTPPRSRVPSGPWPSGEAKGSFRGGRPWLKQERSKRGENVTASRKKRIPVKFNQKRRSRANGESLQVVMSHGLLIRRPTGDQARALAPRGSLAE